MLQFHAMMKPPPPTVIAIILCEASYTVNNTQSTIIVNAFHALGVPNVPCRFPKITVLVTLTNGHGHYALKLSVVRAATGQSIYETAAEVTLADPLMILDSQAVLCDVPLPADGKYYLEQRANGELIGQRPFFVCLRGA
jgi:hypothetical protein